MPKIKITSHADVDAIPYSEAAKQIIWWSSELDHFGVRVGAREKVYIVGHRVNRKWRLIRLGRAGEITVRKAVKDAKQILGQMVGGIDPAARERARSAGGLTLRQAWGLYQQALKQLGRSPMTLRDYRSKIECHLSDWLDRPLVSITRTACRERHTKIGEESGPFMANGVMRTLRAIWRKVRREHPDLPEAPTAVIDYFPEPGRSAIITDWGAWWDGVQGIADPVRRDLFIWLMLSGCRGGESVQMAVEHVDLETGVVKFPITKTTAFTLPLSTTMIDLLRKRIKDNGDDCEWVFPSNTSANGHIREATLLRTEATAFKNRWTPHVLRHSWITIADQKVKISDSHQRALTNHKPKRAKNGDAHAGYIHPDLDDLRDSEQLMTDYLLAQIEPKPGRVLLKGHIA